MKTLKEPPRDASRPMKNPRKELFAELYTFELWGHPVEAAVQAGYTSISKKKIRMLLTDPAVADRIRYLRHQIASQTIADEVWIKDKVMEIVQGSDKAADKLKALAGLYRAVSDSEKTTGIKKGEEDPTDFSFDSDDEL